MTDDLRNQLADVIADHGLINDDLGYDCDCHDSTCENPEIQSAADWGAHVADALLARFAVAGPLPEPDTRYHYPDADRWIGDPNSPIVYLASNGQIDFAGPGYWNTRKGDDPRPFAAALIAAWQKAQEQRHES